MCVNKIQKLFKLVLFVFLSPFWEMAKFAHLATLDKIWKLASMHHWIPTAIILKIKSSAIFFQ